MLRMFAEWLQNSVWNQSPFLMDRLISVLSECEREDIFGRHIQPCTLLCKICNSRKSTQQWQHSYQNKNHAKVHQYSTEWFECLATQKLAVSIDRSDCQLTQLSPHFTQRPCNAPLYTFFAASPSQASPPSGCCAKIPPKCFELSTWGDNSPLNCKSLAHCYVT